MRIDPAELRAGMKDYHPISSHAILHAIQEEIRHELAAQGMNVHDLAKDMDIPNSTAYRALEAQRTPILARLSDFLKHLGYERIKVTIDLD